MTGTHIPQAAAEPGQPLKSQRQVSAAAGLALAEVHFGTCPLMAAGKHPLSGLCHVAGDSRRLGASHIDRA